MTCPHGLHPGHCPICRVESEAMQRGARVISDALAQARAASYLEGRAAGLEEAARAAEESGRYEDGSICQEVEVAAAAIRARIEART